MSLLIVRPVVQAHDIGDSFMNFGDVFSVFSIAHGSFQIR
jgi:hypothetical protein